MYYYIRNNQYVRNTLTDRSAFVGAVGLRMSLAHLCVR